MRRFVTYLYTYERGAKLKNAGFVKVDIRNEKCRMEISVRTAGNDNGLAKVFLYLENNNGLEIGTVALTFGSGNMMLGFDESKLEQFGYGFEQIQGVIICEKDLYLASSWVDEPMEGFTQGKFEVIEEATLEAAGCPVLEEEFEDAQEEVEDATGRYERIDITEIKKLPSNNWYLCNNSFLIHGYFNYHYLVKKEIEEGEKKGVYIGVPGVYEKPEMMMAMLFGFSDFEPLEAKKELEGSFGYWICRLEV